MRTCSGASTTWSGDHVRKLRADKSGDLRIVINFISSYLGSGLIGLRRNPTCIGEDAGQEAALKRIIDQNMLWLKVQDGVIDYSKMGTNILKILRHARNH